jgi:hypothetical protein
VQKITVTIVSREAYNVSNFVNFDIAYIIDRRLGRYPMLLGTLMNKSEMDSKDRLLLPVVIERIKDTLAKINMEAGKADNVLKLKLLSDRLETKDGSITQIRCLLSLDDPKRVLIRDGVLRRRNATDADVEVFLFDNCLLLTKRKEDENGVLNRVYKAVYHIFNC